MNPSVPPDERENGIRCTSSIRVQPAAVRQRTISPLLLMRRKRGRRERGGRLIVLRSFSSTSEAAQVRLRKCRNKLLCHREPLKVNQIIIINQKMPLTEESFDIPRFRSQSSTGHCLWSWSSAASFYQTWSPSPWKSAEHFKPIWNWQNAREGRIRRRLWRHTLGGWPWGIVILRLIFS